MTETGINYKFEAGVDPASEVSKYFRDPAEDENLQKQSQNPVADFASVPFQSNTNFNTRPFNRIIHTFSKAPSSVAPGHKSRGIGNVK